VVALNLRGPVPAVPLLAGSQRFQGATDLHDSVLSMILSLSSSSGERFRTGQEGKQNHVGQNHVEE
jgi:hypothetical protein